MPTIHPDIGLAATLWGAQDGLCFHCGERMNRSRVASDPRAVSKEHIYPQSTSGRGVSNNIVLAHRACNTARGNREPAEHEIARVRALYATFGQTPFSRLKSDRRLSDAQLRTVIERGTAWPAAIAELLSDAERGRFNAMLGLDPRCKTEPCGI